MIAEFRKRELREVPLIRLAERRQAKEEASVAAQAAIAEQETERAAAVSMEQAGLDARWKELERLRAEVEKQTHAASEREEAKRAEAERQEQAELDREWSLLLANDPPTVEERLMTVLSDWAGGRPHQLLAVTCQGKEALLMIELDHPEA